MKYSFFIIMLVLYGASALQAQQFDPDKRDERLRSYRVAIFTEVLKLTPDEAQGFWPVYNEFQDNRDKLQDELKPKKQLDAMSDSEVEDQVKHHFEMRQRDLELEKDLYQKLRKVLPLRKIAKIPNAEREFRERLLIKLQEARAAKRQERMEQRRGGRN